MDALLTCEQGPHTSRLYTTDLELLHDFTDRKPSASGTGVNVQVLAVCELAATREIAMSRADGMIDIVSVDGFNCARRLKTKGHHYAMACVPPSTLVTGGPEGVLRWWDAARCGMLKACRAHSEMITDVLFLRGHGAVVVGTAGPRRASLSRLR